LLLDEDTFSFYSISALSKHLLFLSPACLIPVLHLTFLPSSRSSGRKTHRRICRSIKVELQTEKKGKGVYRKRFLCLLQKSDNWHKLPRDVGGITVPGGVQNRGDVALRDVVSGHGGVGWGWTW